MAILGSLATNIWLFGNPEGPSRGPASPPYDSLAHSVEAFLGFLANGKFISLLTILFGVGLEIQYRSAVRRGAAWPGRYLWRATLLFVEGLVHYLLIFEFDVLMGYAVASVVVAFLVGRSTRVINGWMYGTGCLHLVLAAGIALTATGQGNIAVSRPGLFADGTWWEQVLSRIDLWFVYRAESIFMIPMAISLFLAGVRIWRAGVFTDDERGGVLRRRMMILGLGLGLPLNFAMTLVQDNSAVSRYVFAPMVAAGILALAVTVVLRLPGRHGVLRRGLTAVGKTALTGYILQNLLGSALAYGWGLGLAVTLAGYRPWWVIAAWFVLSAVLTVFAVVWLRHFSRGPVELFWTWAQNAPRRKDAATTMGT
ncbi:DUF418 domain-containing protein [Amycolatopsis suaedae]|uniref:DUF418 domain-containing protein n=1 Tax=Amycolatopsis suaedae TaxID=2510978 RepID=A0A4V2ELH4_9PSEU|nr:DUF418 domain-containing protein [Amycolatopsis suaedae]